MQQVYWTVWQPSSLSQEKKYFLEDEKEGPVLVSFEGTGQINKEKCCSISAMHAKNVILKRTEAS